MITFSHSIYQLLLCILSAHIDGLCPELGEQEFAKRVQIYEALQKNRKLLKIELTANQA